MTDCHLHLDQRVTTTLLYCSGVCKCCVHQLSVGGVASPSLMPGQTVGSLTHPQRVL